MYNEARIEGEQSNHGVRISRNFEEYSRTGNGRLANGKGRNRHVNYIMTPQLGASTEPWPTSGWLVGAHIPRSCPVRRNAASLTHS